MLAGPTAGRPEEPLAPDFPYPAIT
jgi:hypothetical protein